VTSDVELMRYYETKGQTKETKRADDVAVISSERIIVFCGGFNEMEIAKLLETGFLSHARGTIKGG